LIEFLEWDYNDNKNTFFQEIKRLEPCHYLYLIEDKISIEKYELNKEKILSKFISFDSVIHSSISNSVGRFKDKKIGLMMSGGLDSSSIAIGLKKNAFQNIETYSANFSNIKKNEKIDERVFQNNVQRVTGFRHTHVEMMGISPFKAIKDSYFIFNEPVIIPNLYLFNEITKSLKNDGIEVILDGNDGDNTISHGYEVIYFYLIRFDLILFFKEVYYYAKVNSFSFLHGIKIFLKPAIRRLFRIRSSNNHSILRDEFRSKSSHKSMDIYTPHKEKIGSKIHTLANENRNTYFRFHNIENISPFYNEDIIEYCLKLEPKKKFNNGYTRSILREYLSKHLPKEHAYRHDKSNLSIGISENIKEIDFEIIDNELDNINSNLEKLIDPKKLISARENLIISNQRKEKDIINLMLFVAANIFLNKNNF